MAWRQSDDPRCPECGGKIAATASYCMHCDADLTDDGGTGGDTVLADDEFGTVDDGTMPSKDRDRGDGSLLGSVLDSLGSRGGEAADSADRILSTADATTADRHRLDGFAGRLTSMIWTDVPDPEGVPDHTFTAPLWMRVPVGLFAGFLVFTVFTIDVVAFLAFLGPLQGWLLFVGFFAIMVWLVRKPLPSDIVGDACYGIALLLLSMPLLYLATKVAQLALTLGESSSASRIALWTVGITLAAGIPAVFFLSVGYAGNRYARSKLDRKAKQRADSEA